MGGGRAGSLALQEKRGQPPSPGAVMELNASDVCVERVTAERNEGYGRASACWAPPRPYFIIPGARLWGGPEEARAAPRAGLQLSPTVGHYWGTSLGASRLDISHRQALNDGPFGGGAKAELGPGPRERR